MNTIFVVVFEKYFRKGLESCPVEEAIDKTERVETISETIQPALRVVVEDIIVAVVVFKRAVWVSGFRGERKVVKDGVIRRSLGQRIAELMCMQRGRPSPPFSNSLPVSRRSPTSVLMSSTYRGKKYVYLASVCFDRSNGTLFLWP